jgi:hypothetical protein
MPTSESPRPTMIGGAAFRTSFTAWLAQSSNLYYSVTLVLLIVAALFSDKIPTLYKAQLNTVVGRSLMILLLAILITVTPGRGGWILGVVSVLVIALILAPSKQALPPSNNGVKGGLRARSAGEEGFAGDVFVSREVPTKNRWLVEKILHEHPERIEEDRIITRADTT